MILPDDVKKKSYNRADARRESCGSENKFAPGLFEAGELCCINPLGLLDIEHPYRCLPLYPYGLLGVFDSNNVFLDKNQKS